MNWAKSKLFLGFACILLVSLISYWFYVFREFTNDDAFITYRYAQNLIRGRGFVFNPGERVLGTTAPLHGLVLGLLGLINPDIPVNAFFLSWASMIGICLSLVAIFRKLGYFRAGLVSSLVLIFTAALYSFFPLETLFLGCILLLLFYAYVTDNTTLLIIFSSLAMWIRLDSVFFILAIYVALFLSGVRIKQIIKLGAYAFLLTLPWFTFAWLYYGNPLSNTASTKTGWQGHEWYFIQHIWERGLVYLLSQPWLSLMGVGVSFFGGYISLKRSALRKVRVLILWLIFYILGYTLMRIFWPHYWYYFPVYLVVVIFLGVGIVELFDRFVDYVAVRKSLKDHKPLASAALLAMVLILLLYPKSQMMHAASSKFRQNFYIGGRDYLYKEISKWLVDHPEYCATIAVYEPGTIAYYSDRYLVDMMGLITLGVGDEMKRLKVREAPIEWIYEQYDPSCYIILSASAEEPPKQMPQLPSYQMLKYIFDDVSKFGLILYAR